MHTRTAGAAQAGSKNARSAWGIVTLGISLLLLFGGAARADEPGGRFRIDLRIGPSFGLYAPADYDNSSGFDLQVDFGVRLFPHGELFIAPGFHYGGEQAVNDPFIGSFNVTLVTGILPIGMRFPFYLGVPGLYIAPAFELGYAVSASIVDNGDTTYTPFGYFAAKVALEYELHRRWRFLLEPVNLPLFFNSDGVKIAYRIMAGVGVRFGP